MKVSYITWEDIFNRPQDLSSANLRYVFPNWEIDYHKTLKASNINIDTYDIIIIDADIWGGTKHNAIMDLLSRCQESFTIMNMMGEWTRWLTWPVESLNKWYNQFSHPNVNLIRCDDDAVKYMQYVFDKPVRALGTPYAINYVQSFKQNDKKDIVDFRKCGGIHRWLSYSVAKLLPNNWTARFHLTSQQSESAFLQKIVPITKWDIPALTGTWEQYLEQLAECKIMIAVDNRFTIGRFCIDAAALGIPCISGNQHSAQKLFPDLICEPYDVDRQLELLNKLIQDADFYNTVINKAQNNLSYYSFSNTKQSWIKCLEEFDLL